MMLGRILSLLHLIKPKRRKEGRFVGFPPGLRSVIRDYVEISTNPSRHMVIPGTGYTVQTVVAVAVRRGFNIQEMMRNELADLPKSKIRAALRVALDDPHNGAFSIVRRRWAIRLARTISAPSARMS